MSTNFSRGAPSRAAFSSASSIFFQSRKVTTSRPRCSANASKPARPCLAAGPSAPLSISSWIFSIPFVRPLAERFYRWFARNRYRLGCGEHCQFRPQDVDFGDSA